MSSLTVFEYTTSSTSVLTTTSSELKAYDLAPSAVAKKSGSSTVWNISYSTTELLKYPYRLNAIYTIFCSSLQTSTYNTETFTQLRLDFCIQAETYPDLYCPKITDYNNINSNQCSRIYSTNNDFNNDKVSNKVQCAELAEYLNVSSTNTIMNTLVQKKYKKFCADNKTTMKECQCYNRADFEAYQNANAILSSGSTLQSGSDCCWYVPCQYKDNITVDPDLQNAYDRISCPSVCQNIIATVNVKNVSLSNINLSNNCIGTSTDNTETTKKDISEEIPTEEQASVLFQKEKEKKTTSTDKLSKNTLILIIVSVVIVGFIIIGMIVSFTIKN
jgi:hypothetical protein